MKIIQHKNWSGRQREVSISDAIEGSIDDVGYNGVSEMAHSKIVNASQILGKLIQNLHESKLLTDDEIKDMLNWKYTVEE
jgi:hypothetical protein